MTDSAIEYGINISKDVMILMRDGVRLATDIYRPTRNGEPTAGEFPTILGRTSYDKNSDQMWIEPVANFFTPRGYVVVLQDLRGRHHSEGMGQYFHTANPQEGEDGYDTIEWIAEQTWSNGRVGMTGSSHGGIVQTAAAAAPLISVGHMGTAGQRDDPVLVIAFHDHGIEPLAQGHP